MIKERLKSARKTLGLTQETFGKPLGLKRFGILGLESGKVKISTLLALALEHVYGINAEWLLSGTGEMYTVKGQDVEQASSKTSHSELVYDFTDKPMAQNINRNLSKLEKVDPASLVEIDEIIKLKLKLKGLD